MTATRCLDIDVLFTLLKRARRRGARSSRLLEHTPDLVELLYPAEAHPSLSANERARAAETLIRQATDVIGGDEGYALAITLGLPAGTMGQSLEERRALAAERMGVKLRTWERGWKEGALFKDLANEVHRLHQNHQYGPRSDSGESR